MGSDIIERYVYDAMNARAALGEEPSPGRRTLATGILRDIDVYFADHMDDLRQARDRLAQRGDAEGRRMLAFVDETLSNHADADTIARAAVARARLG